MSAAMPGKITAGARSVPCDELTSTMSPSSIFRRSAVCGLISIQLLHIAEVSGSGISCSHGRCAVDPSPNCCDRYGRKWNGNCVASPSNCGSKYLIPRATAADEDEDEVAAPCAFAASSAVFHGSATGDLSLPATSISTS